MISSSVGCWKVAHVFWRGEGLARLKVLLVETASSEKFSKRKRAELEDGRQQV